MSGAAATAFATDETSKPSIINYICQSPNSSVTQWRNTVSRAIARALAQPDGAHVQIKGEAHCGVANVEIACTAGIYEKAGRVMACSPDTLLSLLKVSAWYAIRHAVSPDEDYEAYRRRNLPRIGLAAFLAVSKENPEDDFDKGLDVLRQQEEDSKPSAPITPTRMIFEGIVDLVFAALIGHESSHLEASPPYCVIAVSSKIEETGLWNIILRIARSGELYKSETPVVAEVTADRCASRRIRIARADIERSGLTATDQDFVRRAAADIVSTMLLVRFAPGTASPSISLNDSYLYTPLRIIALAGEIGLKGSGPAICGGAAENLTEATQFTFKQRPGNGLMPDEIENLFPKGVIDAWERRGDWSPASFSCR